MATTVKTLRQRHRSFQHEHLEMIRALYEGGRAWHKQISHILPKAVLEDVPAYNERKKQAGYSNHVGGLLNLLIGHLFSEPVEMTDGGEYWDQLKEDADGAGMDWEKFWAGVLLDALKNRQSFVAINLPDAVAVADTLAEQERSGALDAFLVHIDGDTVIDWGEDNKKQLTWAMVETKEWRRAGAESATKCVWRWREYREKEITTWEWSSPERNTPLPEDTASEVSRVAHGYGLPVVRLRLPVGMWMGDKLHDPALRLTRSENSLDWALYAAAHALLWIKDKWGDTETPSLGPGRYLRLSDPEAAIGYAEPSGSNFEILRVRVKDLRVELYRVVQAMAMGADPSASQAAQSGESKTMDWKSATVMLTAYAHQVIDAMTKTGRVVARIRNDATPKFSGLNTGEEEGTDTFLERAALALDAREFSPKFRKVVAKREAKRILGDEVTEAVLAEILEEIDAAVVEPAGVFMPTEHETDQAPANDGGTLAESDIEPLNGAQIKSAKEIVTDVADGLIPREVGISMLIEFLGLTESRANRIMGEVGRTFKTPKPAE